MDQNTIFGVVLTVCTILITFVANYIRRSSKKTQLSSVFLLNFICVIIWNISMIAQIFLSKLLNIPEIYFDYVAYIGICFLPVCMLFTGILFVNTKIKFRKQHLLLFVIPIMSLLVLWTNDFHHLFYEDYSTVISACKFGSYFMVHSVYSYACVVIALLFLLSYSIKNSGFFSKQSLLIIAGTLFPTLVNALATFGILDLSIYVTPIAYIVTLLFYSIALFKLKFLKATPIALQRIVDRISDSYIVLDDNFIITDFNRTFLTTFNLKASDVRNINLFDLFSSSSKKIIDESVLRDALHKVKNSTNTIYFEKGFPDFDKYFHIEINTITSKGNFLGILILLKDTTQHMQDMKMIQDNQEMLMEKERLASLGQLIGGIAHNLKTPIMSISGAAEGLTDLVKEYEASIGDPDVNENDHHDIANDMSTWIDKIKSYTEYMSDVITAVKGQAVTLSNDAEFSFSVDEVVKRVDILMKHELKNALISLRVSTSEESDNIVLNGNVNSLVQVINNMISNSIQAYNGKTNEVIDFIISKNDDSNTVVFTIKDYAGGLPKEVSDKLFKEMITTKGKNGTGLGLFMSYSNIRAYFNGNITFNSEPGVGTEFHISLPI